MPLNGATIRGHPGPHITRTGRTFNPETGIFTDEVEFTGGNAAINGLAARFRDQNRDFRVSYEEGMAKVTVYTELQGSAILDKYEIVWEMEQRSIWNHPTVKESMIAYDDALAAEGETFRKRAEDAVDNDSDNSDILDPVFAQVVAHLRAGADTWEQEYVVLRRTRTIPPEFASPVSIAAASLIYTTGQLGLPGNVLFQLPDLDALVEPDPTNFQWGWRRRPSSSTIQGQSNEQVSEFILAAWSLLYFTPATGNADW